MHSFSSAVRTLKRCLLVRSGLNVLLPSFGPSRAELWSDDKPRNDLLVIRADRDKYYCGADDMLNRHIDLTHKLCLCMRVGENFLEALEPGSRLVLP